MTCRHNLYPIGYGISWCLKCERHFDHDRATNKVRPSFCQCCSCKKERPS